ncbi:MAG: Verru_Chthon cassette protein A [Verrucomicrobiota bacterium]
MKHIRLFLADARRHQGLALIIVLSMLALATIVILAFLSVADTENKATNIYSASQASRRFADTAVNMVIAQIRSGSARENNGVPVIHATQPGAVRKYAASGAFLAGYKLFSDKDMIFRNTGGGVNTREQEFVSQSEPPSNWNDGNNSARYVDMNEPVIKGVVTGAQTNQDTAQIYFPIIDPRAGQDIDPTNAEVPVEGFSYDTNTQLTPNNNIGDGAVGDASQPIVKPTGAGAGIDQLRLAMPVQWLYVLKDGAVGYLLEGSLQFRVLNSAEGGLGEGPSVDANEQYGVPSETNPIVGRVAFWTDDETSKININTASEPTFAGLPIYYHERDHRWADFPPARSEYQRFAGHPATVALSSVFYPNPLQDDNRSLDTYGIRGPVSGTEQSTILDVKERLYEIMPRIHTGGSKAGTTTFEQDDYRTVTGDTSNANAIAVSMGERLYSSVDELLFAQGASNGRRILNTPLVNDRVTLFSKTSLERSSAFLTAQSRGSEINLFGLPRIAMWPLPRVVAKRTGFDKLMEFCTRLGTNQNPDNGNSYIFQREHSATLVGSVNGARYDISLPRNIKLLNMLDQILDQPFPTASSEGTATAKSFKSNEKLGVDNARQVLVSMFDYIRTTNLYDSFLVKNRSSWPTSAINQNTTYYQMRDSSVGTTDTYTPGAVRDTANPNNPFNDRFLPGHGQVTPSEHPSWTSSVSGDSIRGYGRFVSLSEIGLQFICTADGQPDMYSWRIPALDTNPSAQEGDFRIPNIAPANLDAAAQAAIPIVSGGRTALRVREQDLESFHISHAYPIGFDGSSQARLTNVDAVRWRNAATQPDGTTPAANMIKERYYSNFPPLRNADQAGYYGTTAIPALHTSPNYGRYYRLHPGYDWRNWNWTLDFDQPLTITQKRVQALLHLEFFIAAAAYTEINPDYTVVISGTDMSSIEVNGRSVFATNEPVAIRSEKPLYETDGHPEIGGFASFRNVALGRRVGPRGNMPEDSSYDGNATSQVHSGLANMDLVSSFFTVEHSDTLRFTSGEMTLKIYDHHVLANTSEEPVQVIKFKLNEGEAPVPDIVTTGSYAINYQNTDGSTYNHPAIQAPRWWSFSRDGCLGRFDTSGAPNPDLEAATNRSVRGRFYRWDNVSVNTNTRAYDPRITTPVTAPPNQSVPGAVALIYTKDAANYVGVEMQENSLLRGNRLVRIGYGPLSDPQNSIDGVDLRYPSARELVNYDRPWHFGSDVVRTLQPAHGDPRIIAAKKTVPASDWTPHRLWNDTDAYTAHNFSSYTAGTEPGFDRGEDSVNDTAVDLSVRGLPAKVILDGTNGVGAGRSPDLPHSRVAAASIQRYYDFDDSDPGGRVGPFINKVDEGNYAVGDFTFTGWPAPKKWRATYFRSNGSTARFANGQGNYFSPNRMVPSPVVMGSLPSRIWDTNGNGAWTNLLFRPYVTYSTGTTGAFATSASTHPGASSPPDHYLLDLFWMPVVEPYAISESFSTAGKINLNYQMLPFTHIRRATAVHAAMKGEIMAAIPNADYEQSKAVRTGWGTNGSSAPIFRSEADAKYWHRSIVLDQFRTDAKLWWQENNKDNLVQGTLRQFEERFNFSNNLPTGFRGGLFRTASQLCEIHLIPSAVPGATAEGNVISSETKVPSDRNEAMAQFWGAHCATGDNTRERPYANLYSKFTTRSNTFRVHVRAQAIRKARRSVAADEFNPDLDLPSGEFRGSFLIERYIDQTDMQEAGNNVDYASAGNPFALQPLESYYRFRVLESKRFAP